MTHRATVVTKKDGDKLLHTASCACGYRSEEQPSRMAALDAWDGHLKAAKRA